MPRRLVTLLAPALAALLAVPAFAESHPAPAPAPMPQSIPIQLTPPKTNVTIRTITLDAAGAVTPEGQKVLDEMIDENWRAMSITTVSSGNPVTIAVMFARIVRPGMPPPQQLPSPVQIHPVAPAPHPVPPQAPSAPPGDHNP